MKAEVKYIINSFNKVFNHLGQMPLLENPAFQIDNEMKSDHFIKFNSVQKEKRIRMTFEISTSGLTFWLDETNEIPEWTIEFIKINKDLVEAELRQLFECKMLVIYKRNQTIIILYDKNGFEKSRFSHRQGLYVNWFSSTKKRIFGSYFEN